MGSRKSLTKLGNTKYLTYNCNRNMKLITESKISPRHLANLRSAKQRTLFLINHLKEMSIYKSNLVCELLDLKDKNQYTILSLSTHTICEITRHNYKEVGKNKFLNIETLHKDEIAKSNALLISKAPEMLEMLKILLDEPRIKEAMIISGENSILNDNIKKARQLIKEATTI